MHSLPIHAYSTFFWFSVLLPSLLTLFVDAVGCTRFPVLLVIALVSLCPLSAFNGIDVEYYKKGNRLKALKSKSIRVRRFTRVG